MIPIGDLMNGYEGELYELLKKSILQDISGRHEFGAATYALQGTHASRRLCGYSALP